MKINIDLSDNEWRWVRRAIVAATAMTLLRVGIAVATPPIDTAWVVSGQPVSASDMLTSLSGLQAQIDEIRALQFPVGTLVPTAGTVCPTRTIAADGASLERTGMYAALFAAVGTTYGTVDPIHFTIPDARGVFVRGAGTRTINGRSYTGTRGVSAIDTTRRNGLSASSPPHSHVSSNAGNGNSGPYGVATFAGGLGNITATNLNLGVYTTPTAVSVALNDGDPETSPANISVLYCITF